MQSFTLKKLATIAGLVVVLLITLEMVSGVVSERTSYRNSARHTISQSWTGAQKVIGPILVVPYKETISTTSWDSQLKKEIILSKEISKRFYFMPEQLDIDAAVQTERRYRGMYAVPVYTAKMQFQGKFNNQALREKLAANDAINSYGQPYLALFIEDIRGIPVRPEIQWQQKSYHFKSGSGLDRTGNGMHVMLPKLQATQPEQYVFDFSVNLRGMETLAFAATGISSIVKLKSNWPHPGFIGRYLPENRQINQHGFEAAWRVSSFSSGIKNNLEQCKNGQCQHLLSNTFGVTMTQPVDIYLQSERAIKYGVLFITLTFTAIVIFEVLKKLQIHPVQYLLVGLALVIFYLLLVSLSEHFAFFWSYFTAAAACSALLGYYLSGVLHSIKQGFIFSVMILILYGILYVILSAEDFALLMGCLLLFAVLTLLMVVTRKVDWYALDQPKSI